VITLFTGMPGAGKTASMLDLLKRELNDRPIFVHFDPESKKRPGQALLHESLQIPHQVVHADNWHKDVPDGAVLVIDEVQDVWRPRGPASKVPDCIQALETHRHGGIDIFLTTQSPRLVDANVRGLVGRHVHIRDTGWLGRWWYEWPETNDGLAWKMCPVKKRYSLPKAIFNDYRSANVHTKPIRGVPKLAYFAAAAVLAVVVLGAMVTRSIYNHTQPADIAKEAPAAQLASAPVTGNPPAAWNASPGQRPIDDRVDWIPKVSFRPESAPAYEPLRKVVAMPRVTGAICVNEKCTCYTQQNTVAQLSNDECTQWVQNKPFDPYKPDEPPPGQQGQENQPVASQGSSPGRPLS
jgi:zona occludens toxin